MANRDSHKTLGATDSGLTLSAYPLGSRESRVAARALLDARRALQGEGTLVCIRLIGRSVTNRP